MSNKIWALVGAFLLCVGLTGTEARAATCGGTYRVQPGDSLSLIADGLYKNAGFWTAIHQNNIDKIGPSPDNISVGMALALLCIDGLPMGLEGGVEVTDAAVVAPTAPLQVAPGTAATARKINFLTADDYAPFTDRKALNGGLVTEVVQKAMERAAPAEGFAIHWVNDWSAHLEPLLSNALLDMGFPWLKPDCAADPANDRCANFHFSDPLFEMPIQLFVAASSDFTFDQDSDVEGKVLCRPKGYYTHDLDAQGRNWLKEGKITLVTPATPDDCFTMLGTGEVDAVPENLFLGAAKIKEMGLRGKVKPLERPLSSETLHVIVSKKHWRGTTFLYRINAGLAAAKAKGRYDEVVNRHLGLFMEGLKAD